MQGYNFGEKVVTDVQGVFWRVIEVSEGNGVIYASIIICSGWRCPRPGIYGYPCPVMIMKKFLTLIMATAQLHGCGVQEAS